ncbi:hypothetical protein CPB83DRAFT_847786 [Crepidotus variabilis]|uniref:J domain-containing protein n=1 Tax=Crepidotus variabilis TaxID=179855 RepID=A0A9P6ENG0_9AGAR|nr:hypothetical protein CPB83DRAFT_847786 [Crepidotus variabilis]
MPIRQDVQDAFTTLGLNTDADLQQATKAYKRLALLHHPDRNHNDPHATQRFQEIGHAWDICQRYYENPAFGESRFGPDDDDDFLDEEDMFEFYMFMFAETLFNRYNRESGKRYRFEQSGRRRGRGGPVFTFSPTFSSYSSSYADESQERKDRHEARQKAHNDAYERRKRELELEIEREEREAREQAKKQKADEDRLVSAHERAFQAAYSGDSDLVQNLIKEFNLDITAPRNLRSVKNLRKQDDTQYETLLHAAATHCDEHLFMFLIERGANPNMLNKHQLTPFHAAIKAGNNNLVRFIIERRGKAFQGYHPSKTTLAGHTPLQLAIESGDRTTVDLLVKHATVHDVERCWKLVDTSEELKNVLRTKKGFVPPGEGLEPPTAATSKKVQKQQELAQEKEARIAEELRRAEINRQKKEERAAKRALIEQEKKVREEEERIKRGKEEAEERQKVEELRRQEEAVARARELEEARLRVETEAKLKAEQEAKDRAAAVERVKLEKERQRIERERLQMEKRERERLEKEKRTRERLENERRDQERLEREKHERELAERQKALKAERERQAALERQERSRQAEATRKMEEVIKVQPVVTTPPAPTASLSSKKKEKKSGRPVLTEEQQKELRREKQRERRRAKAIQRQLERAEQVASPATTSPAVVSQPVTPLMDPVLPLIRPPQASSSSVKAKSNGETKVVDPEQMNERQRQRHEQAMRRRAEQSVRDKERHRRLMEERKAAKIEAKKKSSRNETPEYVPLTPVSTHTARTSVVPPPASVISPFGAQPFMEDIQTQIGVDDLFRVERPAPPLPMVVVEPPVVPKSGRPYRKFSKGQPSRT